MADESKGDKFPLIIYQRWAKIRRPRGLFIAIVSAGIWWYVPSIETLAPIDWVFILTGVVGVLLFLFGLLAPRAAYVQCLPNYVKIRTPFTSTAVSYRRILQVRPVDLRSQFTPSSLKGSQRSLIQPFLGRTSILLELNSFPMSESRLRRLLPWHLFSSEANGFILAVGDWMALSRQISVFSDRWVARRQARQAPRSGFMR